MYTKRGSNTGVVSCAITRIAACAIVLVLWAMTSGCASTKPKYHLNSPSAPVTDTDKVPKIVQSQMKFRKEYILAPGDQLEVMVRRVPEVSRSVQVTPDGFVVLPLIKSVPAAGLTVPELETKLTELFSQRLLNPEVNVIPTALRPPAVYVVGDVNNASPVALRNAGTVIQAITACGGFRRTAANRDVIVIRLTPDGYLQAIPMTSKVGGQPGPYLAMAAAQLQPDDIIFVPESGRSQLARFLDDFVNRPIQSINQGLAIYVNYRLVSILH